MFDTNFVHVYLIIYRYDRLNVKREYKSHGTENENIDCH